MVSAQEIQSLLESRFPNSVVQVKDLTGGGDHWDVEIKSTEFAGQTVIGQHRMVYDALGPLMDGPIHALKLKTTA